MSYIINIITSKKYGQESYEIIRSEINTLQNEFVGKILKEDETSYWTDGELYGNKIQCGFDHGGSTVNVFKKVIDRGINKEFLCKNFGTEIWEQNMNNIGMITFAHNCIIIVKKDSDYKCFDNRKYRFEHFVKGIERSNY